MFLQGPAGRFADKTLFINALDEHRRRSDGGASSIERWMGRLLELGQPTFRLACRAADWYGESDADGLTRASASGRLCVLRLLPLSVQDVEAIAGAAGMDGADFRRAAVERGFGGWLGNPLNLKLLLEVVEESGWPSLVW